MPEVLPQNNVGLQGGGSRGGPEEILNDEGVQREDDDEGQQQARNQEPLPDVMGPNDPRRMMLLREEQWCALDIKDVIEAIPELDNLSDFMYAQLAIICKDDLENAVERAMILQGFRQEYDIRESYQEGCCALQGLTELFPRTFLSFSFSPADGCYVCAHDVAQLDTSDVRKLDRTRAWFVGIYYLVHIFCPDLESIRKGCISMAECEGMDWTKKPDFKLIHKVFTQLLAVYPFTGKLWHYNTGVIFNTMAMMLKRALPSDLRDRFRVGLTLPTRLDKLCLVPDAESATGRMLRTMKETLELRFENERVFSLSNEKTVIDPFFVG